MKSAAVVLSLILVLAAAASGQTRIVAVSGSAQAGLSFELVIISVTLTRTIPFGPLAADYSPQALTSLMIEGVNNDFRRRGNTGFEARALTKADGDLDFTTAFMLSGPSDIIEIKIGPPGGGISTPRAPGVAFNPTFTDHESDLPTPLLGFQPSTPNADVRLNGQDPALNHFRIIEVAIGTMGGILALDVFSGANTNAGITLLLGPFRPFDDGVWLAPWGDILELGIPAPGFPTGVFPLVDGIWHSTGTGVEGLFHTDANGEFSISVGLPPTILGLPPSGDGFQALVMDPTATPFCLRLSAGMFPDYGPGRERVLTVQPDSFVPVDFLPGRTFSFYGQSYTQLFAHENGFVTFGAPLSLPNAVVDPNVALNGPPAIFAQWADWSIQPGDGLRIREFRDQIRISWGRTGAPFGHAADVDVAAFELTLDLAGPQALPDAGAIRIEWLELDPTAVSANDGLVGVSPGLGLDPGAENRDLGLAGFGDSAFGALLQQDAATQMSAGVLPVGTAGLAPIYANGSGLAGRTTSFFPPIGTGPNGNVYHAFSDRARPDDLAATLGAVTLSASAPGVQTFAVTGYFQYAHDENGAPQAFALLDPLGTAGIGPFALQIGAVAADAGAAALLPATTPTIAPPPGTRSFEVLELQRVGPIPFPVPATVTVDLRMVFASGLTVDLPQAVTIVP